MGLRSYLVRRLAFAALTIYVIMTLNFIIFRMMPGDPITIIADSVRLRPEQVAVLEERFGLKKPLWEQYIDYVAQTLQGFFGYSYYTQRPVAVEIMERLPNTLLLIGTATTLAIMIGIFVGMAAAARRGGAFDFTAITFGFLGSSIPSFWLGLILLLVFGVQLRLFPLRGTMSAPPPAEPLLAAADVLWHLFLPALTLTAILFGSNALIMRASMMDVLTEDYITMLRAKGLKESAVLHKHALGNAILPMVTIIALQFGFILSGAILTETVFSWHGLGRYIWVAIQGSDYPSLQGIFFIISVMVVLANLIADILYGLLDPRVRLSDV